MDVSRSSAARASLRRRQASGRAALPLLPLLLLALLAGSGTGSLAQEPAAIQLQPLAEGVWVALQTVEGRFDDSNSLILLGDSGVTVVDAQTDPEFVRATIAAIGEITPLPVERVINTHWHGDHTQGNAIYRSAFPDLEIVGHATLVEDVPARAAADIRERVEYFERELPGARERLEQGVFRDGSAMTEADRDEQAAAITRAEAWLEANRGVEFLVPDRTYEDRLTLQVGARTVELFHARAHTRGDTFVWLPDDGILATGDVVDDLPFIGHGFPAEWVAALDRLLALPVTTVVPGHGPVFEGTAQIEAVRGFVAALVARVGEAVAAGRDLEAATASVDLSEWRERLARDEAGERFFDAVLPAAVERAWLEARGEIED